jgi:hypothetical protein
MTVLPQLERELRSAHDRRRRRGWRGVRPATGWVAVAVAVAVVIVVAVAIGSVGGQRHTAPGSDGPSAGGSEWPRLMLHGVDSVQAYALGGSLYVAERARPDSAATLVRLSAATGREQARTELGTYVDGIVLAQGSLWVTTTRYPRHGERGTATLFRFDPQSLDVRSTLVLPGSGAFSSGGSLTVAGGWLWVGGFARLDRVSLSTGELSETVRVPGASRLSVAADPSGRVLLTSAGNSEGLAHVQRRDPVTGALLATSPLFEGVVEPGVGGVIDGGVWFSESTGLQGYVGRLDLVTLKATGTQTPKDSTNGIEANVIDGILWITQVAGGRQRNYCGNPVTGRSRAPLANSVLNDQIEFLTADAHYVYLDETPVGADAHAVLLIRQPISPRCR